MSWLYRYEVKGIQSYVLGTGRLTEIAGGSAVIDGLPGRMSELLGQVASGPVERLQAAAGSGTLRFQERADLEAFAAWWPMVIDELAPALQLVQAWGPGAGDVGALAARLRLQRNQISPDLPEAGAVIARAGRTSRPAVSSARAPKSGLMDRASEARRRAYERTGDALGERLSPDGRPFITDHDQLPETIAVLHVDGNDIGRRVMNLGADPRRYKDFSEALSQATEAAAVAAIKACAPSWGDGALPARPVVLGGDDFTILLPATDAMAFAQTYLETFQRETDARAEALGGKGMSACGGIAFVKRRAPFASALRLAESLCGAAKQRHRDGGGLAFHHVTTSYARSWEEILREELSGLGSRSGALTRNPYALDELQALRSAAVASLALPRGGLREWARLARFNPRRAGQHWARLKEVASEGGRWADFASALEALGCEPDKPATAGGAQSPILDLLVLNKLPGWRAQ